MLSDPAGLRNDIAEATASLCKASQEGMSKGMEDSSHAASRPLGESNGVKRESGAKRDHDVIVKVSQQRDVPAAVQLRRCVWAQALGFTLFLLFWGCYRCYLWTLQLWVHICRCI